MEKFQTSIFERTKEKSLKRLRSNMGIFGSIAVLWILFFIGFPLVKLFVAISLTVVILGVKLYDDKYMGITAYGQRKDSLIIAEEYLEVRGVQIPFTELTNLVIYVDEPKEFFGIHHGGNNKIQFEHSGKSISINYVIKNKEAFKEVGQLVNRIENNPTFRNNLRKL